MDGADGARGAVLMVRRYDVAVVGLGAMGAMAAWQAARSGATVIGLDRFTPGHKRGSSHGGSRIFRMLLFEDAPYVSFARASLGLYRELEARSGTGLLDRCGGLLIGSRDGPAVAAARRTGVPYEELDGDALRARFPQHAPAGDDVGLYEPTAGVIRPEAAVRAAVAEAAALGARIETGTRCLSLAQDDRGTTITSDSGVHLARTVILAAGCWTAGLLPELALPIRPQRSVLSWFRPAEGAAADHGPGRFPVFVRRSGQWQGWGIPDVDGSGVKVGVSGPASPKRWLTRPEENWATPPSGAETDPVAAFVRSALPGLRPAVASSRACMDGRTPDGHFVLGIPAGRPGTVVCGGFAGHGFKHAPAVGLAAAQLALEAATELPVGAFSPDRFGERS
ncbi:N-methyl-L-tryptophan oxidase [Streptomyces sp. NPDC096339]|uniref:N-methyl-L-tryptophan oxidase n=1 Tax=Streptomyces sp. NPDC096339 TaxID=3366086 RepID=UPI0038051141